MIRNFGWVITLFVVNDRFFNLDIWIQRTILGRIGFIKISNSMISNRISWRKSTYWLTVGPITLCGRGGKGIFFTPKMGQFFNISAPRPHTSDKTFILHPNYHFDIEKQNCQISFSKNKWKFWISPASSKGSFSPQKWVVFSIFLPHVHTHKW